MCDGTKTQGWNGGGVHPTKNTKVLSVRYGEYRKHFRKTYLSHQGLTDGDANFTRSSTTPSDGKKRYLTA